MSSGEGRFTDIKERFPVIEEHLGHSEPEMYERPLRLIIYGILAVFTIASVLGLIFIKMSSDATSRPPTVAEVPKEARHLEGTLPQGCQGSMYFRCVNDSSSEQYGMGDWLFESGTCKQWNPHRLCLSKSSSHFRTQKSCVDACEEEQREPRCLGDVTSSMLGECSPSSTEWWYYDRLLRLCVRWENVCLYNAFRSLGHCKIACILKHRHL
ncbi:uncharacterized protein LOC135397953 isoform X2 [Ornithodoros turicata]|uniref:uncharacterized protein LOC135397953 isoform X2 n=1 Tax=Ornithodoros turicata TaxID=34597 RepID=UPI00313946C9